MPSGNSMLDGILWGGFHWGSSGSTTIITYYFAHNREFTNFDSDWTTIEQDAYRAALQSWANVANIQFIEVSNPNGATFIEHSVSSGFWGDPSVLGEHDVPDNPAPADGYYNYQGFGWDYANPNGGLQVGGYGFLTLIHEIGHGLGLAHPHDDGGGSTIWPGVTGPFDSYGDNSLNQTIYTVMSYNNGWDAVQDPEGLGLTTYGYNAGPSAFDIAAIQFLYGANTTYHAGNDTYVLPDVNAPGTYWTCIWDAGGIDQIVYAGARNVTIDLTAATLDNSPTGGGVLSFAEGIFGGFTIANGVVIENATAGSGNDLLVGNSANNWLSGGSGNDTMRGAAGSDIIYGNQNNDLVYGNLGIDTLYGGLGSDVLFGGQDSDVIYGNFQNDMIYGNFASDLLLGGQGDDTIYGGQGDDTLFSNLGNDLLFGNIGADLFVFGTNSGVDTIWFFNLSENDHIALQGQSYTTMDTIQGMEVNLSGGGILLLVNIHAADFSTAFFV
jgi:serralysin